MEEKEKKVKSEDDEIKAMFEKTLEIQDEQRIIDEEQNPKYVNTHHAEIVAPIIVALTLALSILIWYAAIGAVAIAIFGLTICKKKKPILNRVVLLFNVIALALSIIICYMWIASLFM